MLDDDRLMHDGYIDRSGLWSDSGESVFNGADAAKTTV